MLQENNYKEDDKNPWRLKEGLYSPYDYVDKDKNQLERVLHYVFKYIPNEKTYKEDLPKFNIEKLKELLYD
jgi:hypothetical protein